MVLTFVVALMISI